MGAFSLDIQYLKNGEVILSPSELFTQYFYGINIESASGNTLSDIVIRTYLKAAQKEVENYFGIRFLVRLVTEKQTFYKDEYYNGFPMISTDFPAKRSRALIGVLGATEQIIYPEAWLSARESSEGDIHRNISIVPTGSTAEGSGEVIFTGVTSQVGLRSFRQVPHYWTVQYDTGFDKLPFDLLNLVGMMASIPLLAIAGDLVFSSPGLASTSLSIDGLSQSLSSTASATFSAFSARILDYRKSIKETVARVSSFYKRFRFTSL